MTPIEFLNLLWETKPADLHILIWTLAGKTSYWFREVGAAAEFVSTNLNDIYIGVGLSRCDYGPHNRCLSDKIAGIAGLWADFDLASEAHSKKPLPATVEEALSLIPAGLPPTIIIITGNGVHVWWLFYKPWIFANDDERRHAAALSFRFQTLFRCISNQRGWTFERLADLARVLRIPGTTNAKNVNNPKPVEAYSVEGRRYAPTDFLQYFDNLSIPDEEVEERAAKETAKRFTNDPIVINQGVSVPDEMLVRWMEQDPRFRNTWNRERDDLSDQSGSGYDMALACFGASIGLSDQQIVDLIVHHRRIHCEQRRTRVEYYQRTISKARKVAGSQALFASVPTGTLPTGNRTPDEDAQSAKTADVTRVMLCDRISQLLGVSLLRLVKVPGKEPAYLMELENGRIEFDIGKLVSQKSVSLALAAKTGRLIPTFRASQWRELAQMMLDACTVVEGTDDLELEGAARIQLTKYLSENPFIPSIEGAAPQDRYKPTVHKGRVAISAADLQNYINRTTTQNVSVKSVAAMLTALGAKADRLRKTKVREQGRWLLPVGEFDPKDYQAGPSGDDDGE